MFRNNLKPVACLLGWKKRLIFIFSLALFLIAGTNANAAQLGESIGFSIDPTYDISGRQELNATLIKTGSNLYFFVDKNWWLTQNNIQQADILNRLEALNNEFTSKIYPRITTTFGSEWKPGIDGDNRITILFHPMKESVGGYFRTADEYLKLQSPDSNEREMLYITTSQFNNDKQLKIFLAHEFIHLVTFYQKDKLHNVSEEVWLNEARAEYVSTFLGYDDPYNGSNLQRRVKIFLESPGDPLTEWKGKKEDYGGLNIFTQYLVEYYGLAVLSDSLKSNQTGIYSLNEALSRNHFNTDFSQIFTDWTIAVTVNDCTLGPRYCFKDENLKAVRVIPGINFLPLTGKSTLSVTNVTKNWAGDWQKIIGGKGVLKLEFSSSAGLNFRVPYIIQTVDGSSTIGFLSLDQNEKGEIYVSDFGSANRSLIIVPTLQTKFTGFDGVESTYPYTVTFSVMDRTPAQEAELIAELTSQIKLLQEEIAKIQARLNAMLSKNTISCGKITTSLSFGERNSSQVRCLQEFLRSQGTVIYPEGTPITGNFLSQTKAAVIRFQEKYASEILVPAGLINGTGFVGSRTSAVINRLLGR